MIGADCMQLRVDFESNMLCGVMTRTCGAALLGFSPPVCGVEGAEGRSLDTWVAEDSTNIGWLICLDAKLGLPCVLPDRNPGLDWPEVYWRHLWRNTHMSYMHSSLWSNRRWKKETTVPLDGSSFLYTAHQTPNNQDQKQKQTNCQWHTKCQPVCFWANKHTQIVTLFYYCNNIT